MSGGLYRGGRAGQRQHRRSAQRRDGWRSVRDAFGFVGSGAGLSGLALLVWGSPGRAFLALGLIAVAAVLTGCAAYAQYRISRVANPQPPAMGVRQVRYHIDDAPTVHVGDRRRR